MSKKIGILSFHRANNYGAVLQNFALQRSIKHLGYTAETIDYRSEKIEQQYKASIFPENKKLKSFISNCLNYRKTIIRNRKFDAFREHNIQMSQAAHIDDLDEITVPYDVVICGSDQVWNETITGPENEDVYTLAFLNGKAKAAYAASAGNVKSISKNMLTNIKNLDLITVREQSLAEPLEQNCGKDVSVVCDPVFLIDEAEWLKMITPKKCNTLFLYFVDGVRDETCKIAKYISKKRKLEIVFPIRINPVTLGMRTCIYDHGPLEFVADIAHADFVVASSFHAVAFSIILHKRIVALLHQDTGSRVKDLISKLHLESRIVTDREDFIRRENDLSTIDYTEADKILNDWKNYSLNKLKEICELA